MEAPPDGLRSGYLNGRLKESIYARCPPGLPNARGKIIEFFNALWRSFMPLAHNGARIHTSQLRSIRVPH